VAEYRTEVHIAADRYVCVKLPDSLPLGRATVIVLVNEPSELDEPPASSDLELDHQDIEWWEEFEDGWERVG
jgi:hypothetical protein